MKTNIIVVFNKSADSILMCLRAKEPYKGLYNLVGGKVEQTENDLEAAYRELFEETGITKNDIILTHFMSTNYYFNDNELQVYVGQLNMQVSLIEEVNQLQWISVTENFFDLNRFAGHGNIGHILKQIEPHQKELLLK